ncbi:MAG TPA: hypothetical protein VF553_02325 [Pyrinomonadaceae bacterium]|jgi:hypothetical protein
MKKSILKSLTMIGLVAMLTLVAANTDAQAQSRTRYTANIPFEFTVGNETLPAGQYVISNVKTVDGLVILHLSAQGQARATQLTNTVRAKAPSQKSMLVFNRYGERYFLAEMWRAGEVDGRQLRKSGSERAVERELAQNPQQREEAQPEAQAIEIAALAK